MSFYAFFKCRNWTDLSLCLVLHNLRTQMWPKKVKECGALCFPPRALDDSHSETRGAGKRKGLDLLFRSRTSTTLIAGVICILCPAIQMEKKLSGERMEQVNDPEK